MTTTNLVAIPAPGIYRLTGEVEVVSATPDGVMLRLPAKETLQRFRWLSAVEVACFEWVPVGEL